MSGNITTTPTTPWKSPSPSRAGFTKTHPVSEYGHRTSEDRPRPVMCAAALAHVLVTLSPVIRKGSVSLFVIVRRGDAVIGHP